MRKLALALLLFGFAAGAKAGPIVDGVTYNLHNHPDGNAAEPFYGLRLDGLLTGNQGHIYTFDFDNAASSMTMVLNGSKLTIEGDAWGGKDNGSGYDSPGVYSIFFEYFDMVAVCGDPGAILCSAPGSGDTVGKGTITTPGGVIYDLVAESGSHPNAFYLGNHRGEEHSGWGWLNHCPAAGQSATGGSCDNHLYASDWLFTYSVPEPTSLALLGLGLVGVGIRRRRKA